MLIRQSRRAWRLSGLPLVVAVPSLAFAQMPSTGTPVNPTPGAPMPAVGAPAASLPGATVPGVVMPSAGFSGAGALTGLSMPPANYTEYGAAVGIGATDNVHQSSSHSTSQTLAAANLFFDLIRSGSRLQMSALGNFSDINYLEHAYSNQVLGRFDGFGKLTLWKHHLSWVVQDDYGDQEINPLESMTPTNLQRVNIFSTGPELKLTPTLSSFVDLKALYSRSSYQNSPFDEQAGTGSISIGHRFSEVSSISLVGDVQQLRFDNTTVNRNYQTREYYGRYAVRGARTAIELDAGLAQANDTGAWTSSPLVRLSLSRNVSPFSSITLAGGRDYQNAMGSFAGLSAGAAGGIPIGAVTQTTANALQTYGNAGWEFHRLRTTIALTGAWHRNQYDRQSTFDVTNADVELSLQRKLTPRLSANVTATADRARYFNHGFTDNFATAGAGLTYRPGRWLVIYGTYTHEFRRTSGSAARGIRFDDNRGFIMIGYYPHSTGTAPPGAGMGMPGS